MIIIDNAGLLPSKLKIVYNPMSELSLALDLISHPEHHPLHLKWAREINNQLSFKEKKILKEIEGFLDGYLNLDLYLDYDNYPFDENNLTGSALEYLTGKKNWKFIDKKFDIDVLITFLHYFWKNYVHELILKHEKSIIEQMHRGWEILKQSDFQSLLTVVSERANITTRGDLKIEKWVESHFDASILNGFFLELSIFSFPHLIIADRHEKGSFWMGWEVPFLGDRIISPGINRISNRSFALSNKSRLRLLLMISEKPMTQKELTIQMGFSKSTISRHIKILTESRLITATDSGRNRKLFVNREILKEFSNELLLWIGESSIEP